MWFTKKTTTVYRTNALKEESPKSFVTAKELAETTKEGRDRLLTELPKWESYYAGLMEKAAMQGKTSLTMKMELDHDDPANKRLIDKLVTRLRELGYSAAYEEYRRTLEISWPNL